MLELRGISKNYNDDQILDNINITFPGRGLYFICGPSGCGKTSLLNIIGKLDLEYEGRVIFQGDDINDIKDYYLNYLAFVFQELNLFTWLNSTDNYLLPSYIRSVSKRVINKVLDKFNLTKLNNKILNLSGGQRQKIAIARAIIGQKHILLCDEPTGSLDDVSSKAVYNLLKEMSDELLVIVVSHDIDNAKKYGDGIIDLSNKKIDFKFKNKKIHKINSFKKIILNS